jgi:hypothetical protein
MKTKLLSNLIALGILACFFLVPAQVKAQNYLVVNNVPCSLTITYTFYSWNSTCGTICATGTTVVPASAAINIPKPANCNCGAKIDITHVNGVAITTITGSTGNVPPFTPNVSGTSNCSPSGIINMNVHLSSANMQP